MTIYITMIVGVVIIELMHINKAKYNDLKTYFKYRWDNLAYSLTCGVGLCMVYPEMASVSEYIAGMFLPEATAKLVNLHDYPKFAGLVIGLCNTPLINWITTKVKGRISTKNSKDE